MIKKEKENGGKENNININNGNTKKTKNKKKWNDYNPQKLNANPNLFCSCLGPSYKSLRSTRDVIALIWASNSRQFYVVCRT